MWHDFRFPQQLPYGYHAIRGISWCPRDQGSDTVLTLPSPAISPNQILWFGLVWFSFSWSCSWQIDTGYELAQLWQQQERPRLIQCCLPWGTYDSPWEWVGAEEMFVKVHWTERVGWKLGRDDHHIDYGLRNWLGGFFVRSQLLLLTQSPPRWWKEVGKGKSPSAEAGLWSACHGPLSVPDSTLKHSFSPCFP